MICVHWVFDLSSFTTHYLGSVLMASDLIIKLFVVVLNVFDGFSHWTYVYDGWYDNTKGLTVVMHFRWVQYHALTSWFMQTQISQCFLNISSNVIYILSLVFSVFATNSDTYNSSFLHKLYSYIKWFSQYILIIFLRIIHGLLHLMVIHIVLCEVPNKFVVCNRSV